MRAPSKKRLFFILICCFILFLMFFFVNVRRSCILLKPAVAQDNGRDKQDEILERLKKLDEILDNQGKILDKLDAIEIQVKARGR